MAFGLSLWWSEAEILHEREFKYSAVCLKRVAAAVEVSFICFKQNASELQLQMRQDIINTTTETV